MITKKWVVHFDFLLHFNTLENFLPLLCLSFLVSVDYNEQDADEELDGIDDHDIGTLVTFKPVK